MARPLSKLREASVARPMQRSPGRSDFFNPAMRQGGVPRRTPVERFIAGDFQARLVVLLGVTVVALLLVSWLT